jgi:hypothetical protein
MKFMCKDYIKKRDMEKVKTTLDLFTELQSREKIIRADTGFLKKLLNKCEKQNAITVVERFENPASRNGEVPMDTSPRVQQHEAFQQAQPVPPHQTESVPSRREGIKSSGVFTFSMSLLLIISVHINFICFKSLSFKSLEMSTNIELKSKSAIVNKYN